MPRRYKMNLSKQIESRIRESGIVARDLIVADFTLQFARQFALPCKKGINIKMMWRCEGVVQVSVSILDLRKNNEFCFCIQENASEKTWKVACIYPVHLIFYPKTLGSDLPTGFKLANCFSAERDKTGKYTFINLRR